MGSFFVVQVRTGSELEAKEMLKAVLDRASNYDVRAIYAMETYTEVINVANAVSEITALDEYEISDYLHIKRIQSFITNLRTSYNRLKGNMDEDSASLLESYRTQIRSLTKMLQNARKNTTKVSSLLKGYILIETSANYSFLPNELWHLIKSVPKVVAIPSKYNVPIEEIKSFFENVDMTPQIEMEFESLLSSVEDIEEVKNELLHEANQVVGTEEEKESIRKIDSLEENIDEMMEEVIKQEYIHQPTQQLLDLLSSVKFFFHKKRERVRMPLTLFNLLYPEREEQITLPFNRNIFLSKLRNFIHNNFRSKGVVIT